MRYDTFDQLVERRQGRTRTVLTAKSEEYSRGGDKLHNFKAAAIRRSCTPLEALQGMAIKHEVSLDDMVKDIKEGKAPPTQAWLDEKIGDAVNYYHLMEGLFVEAREEYDAKQLSELGKTCPTDTKT